MSMKKFRDDYEIVTTVDDRGNPSRKAVYTGQYFEVSLDGAGVRKFRWQNLLLLAVTVGLHFGAGFLDNQGMRQFYIILPYAFAFLPMIYLGAGVFRLPGEVRPFRREEVELSFNRMRSSRIGLIIFLGLGALGEAGFFLFTSALEQPALEILFLALELIAAAAVYLMFRLQQPVRVYPSTDLASE